MKKIIVIEGMSCSHCKAAVEKALNAISGVEAMVDLHKKQAIVNLQTEVADEVFRDVIEEAGYEMISLENV